MKNKTKKALSLGEHDHVVSAYAESASGPGWGNQPIWVVVRSGLDGSHRLECIQPADQTPEMATLYAVSAAAHGAMTTAVRKAVSG